MIDVKTNCTLRVNDRTGCCGECWLNVAGSYSVWEILSMKCQGSKEEQKMLDGMFNKGIDREELYNKYEFTEEEKRILKSSWY